jgi:DNA-binding NarL/FixJ family response regulator
VALTVNRGQPSSLPTRHEHLHTVESGVTGGARLPRAAAILVQATLGEILSAEELSRLDLPVQHTEDLLNDLAAGRHPVAVILALHEQQLELLASIVRDQPLTAVVAVVSDLTGHRTQMAMNAGASWVLNTAARREDSLDALRPLLRLHLSSSSDPRPDPREFGGTSTPQPDQTTDLVRPEDRRRGAVPARGGARVDLDLVQLLCEQHRIRDIAPLFYCSERSLYRRIRVVYEQFGVASRQELRRQQAARSGGMVPAPRSAA